MSKDKRKSKSLLLRILTNKDIQKSVIFFTIALILSFASIQTVTETDRTPSGQVEEDETAFESIYYPTMMDLINATLELKAEETANTSFELLDEDLGILYSSTIELEEGEEKEKYLPDLRDFDRGNSPSYLNLTVENGTLSYTYIVSYSRSPYGLLSLPAIFLAFLGLVFGFKGKGHILGEIKERKLEEKEREKTTERVESKEDISHSEDVIYNGGGQKGDKSIEDTEKGDASHVDFMGISREDNEESDGDEEV